MLSTWYHRVYHNLNNMAMQLVACVSAHQALMRVAQQCMQCFNIHFQKSTTINAPALKNDDIKKAEMIQILKSSLWSSCMFVVLLI